jgi:hypothetical protein
MTLHNKQQECKNAYMARVYNNFRFCQSLSNVVFLTQALSGFAGILEK